MANTMTWISLVLVVLLPSLMTAQPNMGRFTKTVDSVLRFASGKAKNAILTIPEAELVSLPAFCNKLDCPEFKVLQNETGYQLREYKASQWVSTTATGMDYEVGSRKDFHRLFDYISGENVKKQKIKMTAPVIIRIIPGQGPACESNFTMSFFVSEKEANPPQPSDPTVFISKMVKMRVYVRSFGGYATSEAEWLKEAKELKKYLGDKAKYHKDFFYTAGYNSPFQIFNRHNEIWFIAM